MSSKFLDKAYLIKYSNYFKVENRVFSFRNKELFDVTNTPILLELKNNNGSKGYWINRKWFGENKIKEILVKEELIIDVSCLQWYQQVNLDCVFNLK